MNRLWTFPCRIWRVVDGDTVDVEVDKGFRGRFSPRLRLLDVHAPEMQAPTYEEAREWQYRLAQWVVKYQTDSYIGIHDRFGRLPVVRWDIQNCERMGLVRADDFPLLAVTWKADSFDRWLARIYIGVTEIYSAGSAWSVTAADCLNDHLMGL